MVLWLQRIALAERPGSLLDGPHLAPVPVSLSFHLAITLETGLGEHFEVLAKVSGQDPQLPRSHLAQVAECTWSIWMVLAPSQLDLLEDTKHFLDPISGTVWILLVVAMLVLHWQRLLELLLVLVVLVVRVQHLAALLEVLRLVVLAAPLEVLGPLLEPLAPLAKEAGKAALEATKHGSGKTDVAGRVQLASWRAGELEAFGDVWRTLAENYGECNDDGNKHVVRIKKTPRPLDPLIYPYKGPEYGQNRKPNH